MTAAPAATYTQLPNPSASPRAWARTISAEARSPEHSVDCVCGFQVKSSRPREEHAAMLANVGWTVAPGGGLRCPECTAGVIRRLVRGSKGNPYFVRLVDGTWRCTCRGYTSWGHCYHAADVARETAARIDLAKQARDYVDEADAGETIATDGFIAWLGQPIDREAAYESLAAALNGYKRVCPECEGHGGHVTGIGGWDEPHTEGYRCTTCDGEGTLEPPQLAPLEADLAVAAE